MSPQAVFTLKPLKIKKLLKQSLYLKNFWGTGNTVDIEKKNKLQETRIADKFFSRSLVKTFSWFTEYRVFSEITELEILSKWVKEVNLQYLELRICSFRISFSIFISIMIGMVRRFPSSSKMSFKIFPSSLKKFFKIFPSTTCYKYIFPP